MCALYIRCALSVLQKECRKVWGARYRSENTVFLFNSIHERKNQHPFHELKISVSSPYQGLMKFLLIETETQAIFLFIFSSPSS